jgi:hypothetical protein
MTLDASGDLLLGETSKVYLSRATIAYNPSSTNGPIIVSSSAFTTNNGGALWLGGKYNTAGNYRPFGGVLALKENATDGNSAGYLSLRTNDNAADATERARITSGGNLLVAKTSYGGTATGIDLGSNGYIGSYSPDTTNSTSSLAMYSNGASAYRFYVGWGGTVYATNTTISAISDQRFKENIQDLDVGLDKIMALKPRKFDWKAGKGKDIKGDRGFIAQEFEQVFPDLIDEWKDPAPEGEEPYKSVRQDLIPVLVKAIQEQQAMINELKAEVAALKGN